MRSVIQSMQLFSHQIRFTASTSVNHWEIPSWNENMRFNAPALLSNNILVLSTSHFESPQPNQWRDERDLRLKYASFEINLIPENTFLFWDKTQRLQYIFCKGKLGQYTRPFLCFIFSEVTALTVGDRDDQVQSSHHHKKKSLLDTIQRTFLCFDGLKSRL